jgi:hypothetical protein
MRKLLLSIAILQALVASGYAQPYGQREAGVHGVGCYWYRGRHYCSRYCYREVDGYTFCRTRLHSAGSQAPPPVYPWEADGPRVRRR